MQVLQMMIFTLYLSEINCKRKYRDSSSEESIENVLYYQDCKHKQDEQSPPVQLRAEDPTTTRKPQECRMCCSMCCGDECQNSCNQKPRAPKKIEPTRPLRPRLRNVPFVRRDSGLTKDNIKSLISQDTDIRKILKDLVRVTMQKVDLMQLLNAKRIPTQNKPTKDSEYENDL